MANPKLPTDGTHELRERYAADIVALKRKENVVRELFGRDYQGDPRGGSVMIPKRPTEVSAGAYDVVTGKALGTGTTAYEQVLVDEHIAVNELIDGYEADAVPDNLIAQRLDSAAYSLGRTQELYAIQVLEGSGTLEDTATETAKADMYETILTSIKNVKKLGIGISDIKVVISDETWVKLLTDVKFSNTAGTLGAEAIRSGVVGRIGGADVVTSSNLMDLNTTFDEDGTHDVTTEYVVFSPLWAQTVEDWVVLPAINDLKNGTHIGASALQGRIVYKDVLLDATTCRVKTFDTVK